jgi:hypothetical protein
MEKLHTKLYLVGLIMVLAVLVCLPVLSCSSPATVTVTSTPTVTSSQVATQSSGLTVVNGTQTKSYSLAEVKALPSISGWAGQISSTGTITGPYQYKGVAMSELLKAVGGVTENNAVRVSAKDGYTMTLSYKQITEGNFTTIDSSSGKEVAPEGKLTVFVAYQEDGSSLSDKIGPLRLGIMTSKTQVTEGHWWIKWTEKIEVIATEAPWELKLEGAITESIDKSTFESCAAIGCHGEKWTDDQGRVWEGVPLWYFAGRVDDVKDTHKGDAFSDALADQGYEMHLVASDGYMVKYISTEMKRNDKIIVAFKRDGVPLPENQWPLRVVGDNLDKQRMVGKLFKIKLEGSAFGTATSSPSASASPSPAPAGEVLLTVVNGSQTKTYTLDALKAMAPTSGYGATINKNNVVAGPNQYKGVSLMDLVKEVGGITSSNSVKVTAKDGYSKSLTYDQVSNGNIPVTDKTGAAATPITKPVLFIAYEKDGAALDASTGPLQLGILTDQNQVSQGSSWVKNTVKIEVAAAQ